MAPYSAAARPSRPVSHNAGTSPGRSPPPPSSCTQSRADRALPARRPRGSYWLPRVAHSASKSTSIPLSSASPTASASCHARQCPCDRPCIQAIPKPSSSRVPASSQASQEPFSEKAGLSGRLSDSCADRFLVYPKLGREEDSASSGSGVPASRLRLEAVEPGMFVWNVGTLLGVPRFLCTVALGSRSSWIGLITLDVNCAGARSAGNPHATCDEAGAGIPFTVRLVRHSQRKRGATDRPDLRSNGASPRP